MAGFPKLIPAFTVNIAIAPPVAVGAVSKGAPLTVVPFVSEHSFLRSEPGYPIKVDAVFAHGSDYIRQDPSGKSVRLDVNSILNDKSGAVIVYRYTGIIRLSEPTAKVLGGKEDAKTTEFGDAITHVLFETGNEELKELEQKIYVASGRFVLDEGKPVIVEYKVSEVAA